MTLIKLETSCPVDQETVFRRLSITGDSYACQSSRSTLISLLEKSAGLVESSCYYCLVPNIYQLPEPELAQCEKLVLCFATLGPKISAQIGLYFESRDYLEGYLLDHLGNEMLFSASEEMNRLIEAKVREQGYNLTTPFSPGEGHLELEYQALFLEEMKRRGEIPVSINDHYMLNPEKSILYVFGADPNIAQCDIQHDCSRCTREKCYFRGK